MASEVLQASVASAKLRQEMAAFFHESADLSIYRLVGEWGADATGLRASV